MADYAPSCGLLIDGTAFADSAADLAAGLPVALTGLKISWGRSTTVDQPAVSTCSFTVLDRDGGESFLTTLHVGATVDVESAYTEPTPDPPAPVLVWSGRITDLAATPDLAGGLVISVQAADLGADLGNRVIGDEPWPTETAALRFHRITTLAGVAASELIAAVPGALELRARDVDATDALSLLQDVADSTGAVLWAATATDAGPYLWLEDTGARPSSVVLALVAGQVEIVGQDTGPATVLSACDVLAEPVTWVQDVTDRLTRADVTWWDVGAPDPDTGAPTWVEVHAQTIDAPAELLYGVRRYSVSTDLIHGADADAMAGRVLARHDAVAWRVQGVSWDTAVTPADVDTVTGLFDLLDGTLRLGRRVVITDLPDYAPTTAASGSSLTTYLEGGDYLFDRGRWALDLTVSPAAGQGETASWDDLPTAWTWAMVDPAIAWRDLWGVAGP